MTRPFSVSEREDDRCDLPELGSVALVHDYLNQPGGAERVVIELTRIWSGAPLYTSLYRPQSTFPEFREVDVRTSFLDGLPVDRGFRNLFPLYPLAFRFLRIEADTIISSSSGWGHRIRRPAGSFHAVYCHTPARWLYSDEYMNASARQRAVDPLKRILQRADRRAAARADLYIANGRVTQERIRRAYGLSAPIVPPPVQTDRFTPRPRGERLLVVSRLLPYKRVDVIVDAANRAGIGLDVVGQGPALEALRERGGPTVAFHGRLGDVDITRLMQNCRALCLPGVEDFGITPVEANAAGKPVVAFGAGGALETLNDGYSGAFFYEHTADAVLDAVRRCDAIDTAPEQLAKTAERFSPSAFRERLLATLLAVAEARGGG